jgi:hypothetical protein
MNLEVDVITRDQSDIRVCVIVGARDCRSVILSFVLSLAIHAFSTILRLLTLTSNDECGFLHRPGCIAQVG